MIWLLAFYIPFLALYVLAARSRGGLLTPDALFVAFNTIALLGTVLIVDPGVQLDNRYAWLVLGCTTLFTAVAAALRFGVPAGTQSKVQMRGVRSTRLGQGLFILYVVSLLVSLGYYAAVGQITFVESLSAAHSGGSFDAAPARLGSYAGAKYFFPGYVNQFKNSILPIVTLAIVHTVWQRKVAGRVILSGVMIIVMFVMVAGTGQRAPMVIVFLVAMAALWQAKLLTGPRLALALAGGFGAFAIMTLSLQRQATALGQVSGTSARLKVFAEALWSRVALENPESGLAAFHYTSALPTAWGREWATDISGVLPGSRGSDLANRVFEMLYGTPRGTAPASLWGGMYYNFASAGTVAVTAVLATLAVALTRRLYVQHARATTTPLSFLEVLALSGIAVSSGAWVAGSPLTVLNQGFFAYLFLLWFARRNQAKEALQSPELEEPPGILASKPVGYSRRARMVRQ
jgi:hypothetical protein